MERKYDIMINKAMFISIGICCCYFCIGFLISHNRDILYGYKRRVLSKIIESIWVIQDSFFIIHAMLNDMRNYMSYINESWPFFDGIDESKFNHMDSIVELSTAYMYLKYNEMMKPLSEEELNILIDYTVSDLKKKHKILHKVSRDITKKLGRIKVIYDNMLIIRFITENKDVYKLNEADQIVKYRLLKINTEIELYNATYGKRES